MIRRLRGQAGASLVVLAAMGVVAFVGWGRDASPVWAQEKSAAVAAKAAGGWGALKGRFVYGGPAPKAKQVDVPNKPEFAVCRQHPILDQSLVVNGDNKGIADVFVYLREAPGVHPDLAEPPAEPAVLDQKGCTFLPHAQVVRKGQGLVIKSGDPTKHNTRMTPLRNPAFNQIINAEDRTGLNVEFVTGERFPFQVKCDLHPWMTAWILVLDHPYGALSDGNGQFVMEKLPAGTHIFIPWQESAGYVLQKVDVPLSNAQLTSRGFMEVEIRDGETTDLGDVVVPPSKFAGN